MKKNKKLKFCLSLIPILVAFVLGFVENVLRGKEDEE